MPLTYVSVTNYGSAFSPTRKFPVVAFSKSRCRKALEPLSPDGCFYRGIDRSCTLWKEVCTYLFYFLYNLVVAFTVKHVCISANQIVGFVSGPGKVGDNKTPT